MNASVTASVWNYCQNSCPYCIAGSNDPRWAPKKSFEIWKPEGLEHLNDRALRLRLGSEWWHEQCPDKERFLNPADVLPIELLIDWMDLHRPGATVHLSGGEPLLRPDIALMSETLLESGDQVVMFTNGQALDDRSELLDLPIKWCVTYHQDCGLSVDEFLSTIEPLQNKPHVVHTVISTAMHEKACDMFRASFEGFNFIEKWDRNPARTIPGFKYEPTEIDDIASNRLTLVTPDGAVYPCNNCRLGPIGDIYDGTYNEPKARGLDDWSRECVKHNCCSAYQTASLFESINDKSNVITSRLVRNRLNLD